MEARFIMVALTCSVLVAFTAGTGYPVLPKPGWNDWGHWSACSRPCGGGSQYRTRVCPSRVHYGLYGYGGKCKGVDKESRECNVQSCAVNGGWSGWSSYGTCSTTCGAGTQTRTRTCTKPPPSNGGADCSGSGSESQACNTDVGCPIPGGWAEWSSYGTCSTTCGAGSQTRSRTCTNPAPSNGGADCSGNSTETQACNENVGCPVPGGWAEWSAYGTCSTTCAAGTQSRTRACTNPPPSNGGADCTGNVTETQSCNENVGCPVPGGWAEWSAYGICSTTCGAGTQSRTRTCTNPAPSNGGAECSENGTESQACNENIGCPVPGVWSDWAPYRPCSTTCGAGSQSRTRTCTNPPPSNGGADCSGNGTESQTCNENVGCPVNGNWGPWGAWSEWSTWTSNRPSTRTRIRTRACDSPAPAFGGKQCKGPSSQKDTQKCRKYGYNCSPYY